LTSGAKTWLLLLARRSDDNGKPVWGNQVRMGEQIGRCDRSVRRYRAEAEQLGYGRLLPLQAAQRPAHRPLGAMQVECVLPAASGPAEGLGAGTETPAARPVLRRQHGKATSV
jgi:hypothetical protein